MNACSKRWFGHSVFLGIAVLILASCGMNAPEQSAALESAPSDEWQLVRTVDNDFGGTIDLVSVPEDRVRDLSYYREIGEEVCGSRNPCLVNFWAAGSRIPTAALMPVEDLQRMTALYERHPNYETLNLKLACWLYDEKPSNPDRDCFVMPGVTLPWEP